MNQNNKILFIPATRRNADLLYIYAKELLQRYDCLFLRTSMFGENADIGPDWIRPGVKTITANFLNEPSKKREILRLIECRQKHRLYRDFLKQLRPDLIVIGLDWDSIGKWTAIVSKDAGLKTIGCQEGGQIAKPHVPLLVKVKILFLNILCTCFYRQFKITSYFGDSLFYVVWGAYDKSLMVKTGIAERRIFIAGDPRLQARTILTKSVESFGRMLFLDVPSRSTSRNRFDLKAIDNFRNKLIMETDKLGIEVLYKLHPFIKNEELTIIKNMIVQHKNIKLLSVGVAEDYYNQVDFCLTFPSTSIYSILAHGLPLLIITPPFRGFEKIMFDPVKEFGAGLTISEPFELSNAITAMNRKGWNSKYFDASLKAAQYMAGSLDGKAPERFAEVIKHILSNQ